MFKAIHILGILDPAHLYYKPREPNEPRNPMGLTKGVERAICLTFGLCDLVEIVIIGFDGV